VGSTKIKPPFFVERRFGNQFKIHQNRLPMGRVNRVLLFLLALAKGVGRLNHHLIYLIKVKKIKIMYRL
jgi:hypothetical protein